MKHRYQLPDDIERYEPLEAIEEVRRLLGAPRVNISVLWTVVTQLAADLRYAISIVHSQRHQIRDLRELVDGLHQSTKDDPVGGSDSAAPSSETEWRQPCLPLE